MSNVFYDVEIRNNEDSNIRCEFQRDESKPVLEKMEDYRLAVNKFTLPASAISQSSVNPNLTYQTYIGYPKYSVVGISNRFDGYTQVAKTLYSYTQYSYNNTEELLENINRTLIGNFKDICTKTTVSTGNFTLTAVKNSHAITVSNVSSTKCPMLEVEIIMSSVAQAHPTSLKLTNPSGQTCYLYTNGEINDNNTIGLTKVFFSDSHIYSFQTEKDRGGSQYCYPHESLTENFAEHGSDGEWTIEWENLEADYTQLNATCVLRFYAYNKQNRIQTITAKDVPYFSHDKSVDLIVANIPEKWHKFGLRFGFNQYLNKILNFTTVKNGDFHYLQMPQVGSYTEHLTATITVSQNQSSVYQTKRYPSRILIYGELPTKKIISGKQGQINSSSSSIVEEFYIDPAQFDGSDFIFNSQLLRYHDILGSGALTRISLRVFIEYEDAVKQPLMLQPGETARLQLQFSKVEKPQVNDPLGFRENPALGF